MKLGCAVVILGMGAAVMPTRAQQYNYVGEVIFTAANFCPAGTIPLDGQLLAPESNQALFSLIGATYGGNGQTNFAVPKIAGIPTQVSNAPLRGCIVGDKGMYPNRP
jgi:microcystin-dependent protein